MNKFIIAFFLLLATVSNSFSQSSPNDYSYVVVPERFDFLFEPDQYQLNSLTKFLFNKYGFNSFFSNELKNYERCDGLYAEVLGDPGFIYTKITVVLKDCNGMEVFRSNEGRSKEKDYKRSYYNAMREAFQSIEALGVKQTNAPKISSQTKPDAETMPKVTVVKPSSEAITTSEIKKEEITNLPQAKFSNYTASGISYLLRKTEKGYSFYQENKTAADGLELLGVFDVISASNVYFNTVSNTILKASFDASKNLTIIEGDKQTVYSFVN